MTESHTFQRVCMRMTLQCMVTPTVQSENRRLEPLTEMGGTPTHYKA
jgi:hypothetical protein